MNIQHTYETMLSAPLTVRDVHLGALLWCATRALIGSSLMMIVLATFGLIGSLWALAVLPVVFLVGLMFASLGLIATALSPSYSFFSFHFSLVVMPMFFFAGTFFPLSGLPLWFQQVSRFLPLTHAVELVRGLIVYGRVASPVLNLAVLGGCTVVFFLLACRTLGRRLVD